jgi:cellulose synthase/poly-beta-1,6-N-acetylglucosamine synthase-like glycosyltransferase
MLCSVVLPLYNKAPTIVAAIESVLVQSHRALEAIVIDDGSTDDSAERVLRIADPRVRMIRQANQGVSCARNAGIAAARGELVCFLDADDVWHPHFLSCVTAMARAHPRRAFFSTSYRSVFQGCPGAALENLALDLAALPPARDVGDFFRLCHKEALVHTDSVAIRRTALLAMQPCFAPGESLAEDQDLWFRLFEKHGLLHLPLALAAYSRNLPSSLSTLELQQRTGKGLLPAFARLEERARSKQMPACLRGEALRLVANKRITVARHLLSVGERARALGNLLAGWHGLMLARWWFTLLLCLAAKPAWVDAWENRRQQKHLAAQVHRDAA